MAKANAYQDMKAAFRSGRFAPVYLLHGEERWFIDALQKELVEHAIPPHERDFNFDLLYGGEVNAQAAFSACQAYPMMAERRLVVIRDFDQIKDNGIFKALAEHPNPSCVVFLVCSGKPNMSHHPYRALKGVAEVAQFKALYPNEVPRWIETLAKEKGYKIHPRAVQMLADSVGTSLSTAAAELDKLSVYVGDREELTGDDVVQATGQTREYNVFELQRVVGEARHADALRITERLLQQSSNPRGECTRIVSVLSSFFLKLWQLTGLQKQRIAEKDMARAVGVSPYFLKDYLGSLKRYDQNGLDRAISSLLAADFELKGGSQRGERMILHLLLRRMMVADTHEYVGSDVLSVNNAI